MIDAHQHHATQHKYVMSGSCLDLRFERIISLLLLYPRNMHDMLLCWSTENTKIVKFYEIELVGYDILHDKITITVVVVCHHEIYTECR